MRWSRVMGTSVLIHTCLFVAVGVSSDSLDTRALIEQALDERANITLENVPLGEVIGVLNEKSGIKFVMPPESLALAPNGPETIFQKVHIPNIPLRKGVTDLFAPLGMTLVVRDDGVEIVPKPALRSLGRPLTWSEVDALAMLSRMQPGLDAKALAGLEPRLQFQVPAANPWAKLSDAVRQVGAGTGDEVLTVACNNLGWVWYPSDQLIVVTTLEQQIRRRLQKPISLRLTGRPLPEVVQAVGRCADVDIRVEPGAIASLPRHVQQGFSLNVPKQPAEDVLDQIAATTGLGYLIEPDGVLFYRGPDSSTGKTGFDGGSAAPSAPRDPYVAKMVIPLKDGKSVEWLIRQSELPEDLREMRERDIAEVIEALRAKAASANRP